MNIPSPTESPVRPVWSRRLAVCRALLVAVSCSSTAVLHEGLGPDERVRVHTGEGRWGDRGLYLVEVNGRRLGGGEPGWRRLFRTFFVKNDVELSPGEVELEASGGNPVRFTGRAGATYHLALEDSVHDSDRVLVVRDEATGEVAASSEPVLEELRTPELSLGEDWRRVSWKRHRRGTHADAVRHEREGATGARWLDCAAFEIDERPAEAFACAADALLELQRRHGVLQQERLREEPFVSRWSAAAGSEVGSDVAASGFLAVYRQDDVLVRVLCGGPGDWAEGVDEAWPERLLSGGRGLTP